MTQLTPRELKQKIIADTYQTWALEQAGNVPLSEYAASGRSQSAEGEEILGASDEAQADLYNRTQAALAAAGLS